MSRRLLLPLGLAVTGLLVLAAVASRGRPLEGGGSHGAGPTAGFFDYTFTTIAIGFAVAVIVSAIVAATARPDTRHRPSTGRRYFTSVLAMAAALAVAWLLSHGRFQRALQQLQPNRGSQGQVARHPRQPPAGTRGARIRWDEVAIVLTLLAAGGLVVAFRRRGLMPRLLHFGAQERVSLALDESLDDLRTEPDLRKAIIAAYARMEHALAAAGLPRRPAEAPVEYLERALLDLDASTDAVRRLTELFEWAKFSHHEPEPSMRDEAISALVAVRDELRAPEAAVAA
jgi:Domain of unknown function (DUF4129)